MTENTDCNKLDAYLADDLLVDDARRFESHLEVCSTCREAIDEQNWIDSLLQSPERIQIERTPPAILDSFHISVSQHRRVWQTACVFATAAVLVVALGWLVLNRQARLPSISEVQNATVPESVPAATPTPSQATFVATTDAIVVPLESPSTDVTVVQVYPTTDTERRRQFEQSLISASTIPNGG